MTDILKATVNDAELIAQLGKQTFYESHGHSASNADIDAFVAKHYTTKVVAAEFDDPKVMYHLIKYNGTVVGFSKIEISSPDNNIAEPNVTKLARLYLLDGYHGKNLGATLFDFVIDYSQQKHDKGIWLHVWVENEKAVRFYKKNGFKIVGEHDYEISKTHTNPNHVMYLEY